MEAVHEQWLKIFSHALSTPSPHNTQPWKVKIKNQHHAELYLDHSRALPAEDITGCFIRCALGMFAETCHLIAPHFDSKCIVHYHDSGVAQNASLEKIADLTLDGPAEVPPYPLDLFTARQTSRLRLSSKLSSQPEIETLSRVTREFGHVFHHLTDCVTIESIMSWDLEATIADLNTPSYRDEIRKWFRYTERSAVSRSDGLSARCMTIPAFEYFLMAHLPWSAKIPGLGRIIRARYRALVGPSPQLGILEGDFFTRENAFNTGRGFMRLWLEVARLGLYLHPFGNLITNEAAKANVIALTGIKNPWIIFRFGGSAQPPRAARLALEEILL